MSKAHSIESLSDEAFGWYLTGLVDGEGCFSLQRKAYPAKHGPRVRYMARLSISLRDDDAQGLLAIAARMGCGRVYRKPRLDGHRGNRKPQITWYVFRCADLAKVVVPHFEAYPLQLKKSRDFHVWKKAIPILMRVVEKWHNPGVKRPNGFYPPTITPRECDHLDGLVAELQRVRKYVST